MPTNDQPDLSLFLDILLKLEELDIPYVIIGGFAASLGRMVTAAYDSRPFRATHEFGRDGVVSIVIGLGGYWGGMAQSLSPPLLALGLLLGGYAGTRTLSVWVDRLLKP